MEQRGLVERRRDEEDRRIVRVVLTDEGRKLVEGRRPGAPGPHARPARRPHRRGAAAFLVGTRAMRRARGTHARPASTNRSRNASRPAPEPDTQETQR